MCYFHFGNVAISITQWGFINDRYKVNPVGQWGEILVMAMGFVNHLGTINCVLLYWRCLPARLLYNDFGSNMPHAFFHSRIRGEKIATKRENRNPLCTFGHIWHIVLFGGHIHKKVHWINFQGHQTLLKKTGQALSEKKMYWPVKSRETLMWKSLVVQNCKI